MTVGQSGLFAILPPRLVALLLGLCVSALALSVLLGWLLDIPVLRSALSTGAPMRANAAASLLVVGLTSAGLALDRSAGLLRKVALVAGTAVALLALATLAQDLAGRSLGIDEWLVRDATGTSTVAAPGRMSPPTALSLALLGIGLAVASRPPGGRLRAPVLAALGCSVLLIGGIALLGHAVERLLELRFLNYSRIAMYTALAMILAGAALLALLRADGALRWALDRVTTAGFAAGIAAMVITAAVSYDFTSRMRADAMRVNSALELLREIQALNTLLGDFTISAGRYIITRDERTLDAREATKAAIGEAFDAVRRMTAGRVELRARLDRIIDLHTRRVAMSEAIIADFRQRLREGRLPGPGEPSLLGQEYPALGLEIERVARAMEAEVDAQLARTREAASVVAAKTFLLLPLGVLLGVTILCFGLFFLNAGADERRRAQQALARRGDRLALLHEIDLAIIASKTPAQIAEAVLPRLRDLLDLPRVVINLIDFEKGEAEWLAAAGRRRLHVGPGVRFPLAYLGDPEGLKRGEMQLVDVAGLVASDETRALLASDVHWYKVVPMRVGDTLIGGLSFGGASREFPLEQVEIAREVAAQLAIALSQARLSEQVRQTEARFQVVFENVPVGISMTTLDGRLLSANPSLARILGYASIEAAIAALGERIFDVYAEPAARESYLRILRRDGVVTNFETQFLRADGSRIWVSMSGRMVGHATASDSRLVTMIDDIEQRKAQEQRIARLNRMKDMRSGINAAVTRIRERQPLLEELCRIAVALGGMKAAWVAWHDVDAQLLRPVASAGAIAGFLDLVRLSTRADAGPVPGVAVAALREGVSIVTNDIRASAQVAFREEALSFGFMAAMHLPLKVDGAVAGVLVLLAGETGVFDDEERRLLDELAGDISLALGLIEKTARLDFLAYYDPLTGLPNRTLFQDRLAHSLRQRGGDPRLVAVVLLDLERFRQVNETLGRQFGDELLRGVAQRLLGVGESVARIGADLFGLTLRGARTAADVKRALDVIIASAFAAPFPLRGDDLRVACRAGVAVYPDDGHDADTLMRNAEAAQRRSKGSGERIVFYAPDMNARVAESLALENRLRRAVEQRQFVLHYQPKVRIADGRILGAEALIRWQEPGGKLVPPGQFIALLEETGLIAEVGRWAVAQTFSDLRAWDIAGVRVPRIAVNVSAIQLQAKEFVDSVIDEIERGGDMPERLELEITESLVMRNVEDSTRKLSILRGMGVTVSIDDFGTGFSSLSYLSRLPVDSLKIDRSFVNGMTGGPQGVNLVSTIISLAHGLKLKVVAEGVETDEQAGVLRELRCDEAQGYLFSLPLPETEFRALLALGVPLPAARHRA